MERLQRNYPETTQSFSKRQLLISLGALSLSACDRRAGVTIPVPFQNDECEVFYSRERFDEGDPNIAYEDHFLRERQLEDTSTERERARMRVFELRAMYENSKFLRTRTFLGLGADTFCGTNDRMFADRRSIERLERQSLVSFFSGIPESGEPTISSLTEASTSLLRAIPDTRESLSTFFKMHGSEDSVVFGYGGTAESGEFPRVALTPIQLAQAYALRSSPNGSHVFSESEPETILLETCGSGSFAYATLSHMQRIRKENGWTTPVSIAAISSTTSDDIGFTNSLTDLVANSNRFKSLFDRERSIGSNPLQRSNPEVFVIDPESGHVTKIA